jgi:putative SOS response-associated peptidase YedK
MTGVALPGGSEQFPYRAALIKGDCMCGRYASFRENQDLADAFAITTFGPEVDDWVPSWNVAPTQQVRMVVNRRSEASRQLRAARWGLVPSWAADPAMGSRLINARSETLTEKPSFKGALARRRCLIPADGYYEWTDGKSGRVKQPVYFHLDDSLLAFAGLYEFWRAKPDAPWLVTTTIITTAAQGIVQHFHHRQPVILGPETWDAWLDPELIEQHAATELLRTSPQPDLLATRVSTKVNSVANNGPDLLTPVEPVS